jgi:PAS domain-containing protein
MASDSSLPADQCVTASDLVRHFGVWQQRASRAPLYILQRGRPRFVMTTIETMDALCAAHRQPPAPPSPTTIDASLLLDSIGDLVLVADSRGAILASSRAARSYFGALARIGAPITAIVPSPLRAMLAATIRQVIELGVGDRVETESAARAGRSLLIAIEPAGGGVAVIANDGAPRDLQAADMARRAALDAAGGASVTLDLDGSFAASSTLPDALIGRDSTAPPQGRLRALIDEDARPAFDRAFCQVVQGGPPTALDCSLTGGSGPACSVRIGFAPIRRGGSVSGVAAILLLVTNLV